MAKPKKIKADGIRARGVYAKRGKLYVTVPQSSIRNGETRYYTKWISTGLSDTQTNISKASKIREEQIKKKKLSTSTLDQEITISDLVDTFLSTKRRDLADTTYAAYSHKLQHVKNHFGSIKVRKLQKADIFDFLDNMIINRLSVRYVNDIKVLFVQILKFAAENGVYLDEDMTKLSMNKELVAQYKCTVPDDETFFSKEEAITFLNICKDSKYYELFYITLFLGLRRSEVLGLQWGSIDFENKTITIEHTVTKGTTVLRRNQTKTKASNRVYTVTDSILQMLRNIKAQQEYYKKEFGKGYKDNNYVFKNNDGSLYYPDSITKAFDKIIKAHPDELPQGITFHGLRKSCVSILAHDNLPIAEIQKWVGHHDIETTLKIYTKVKEKKSKLGIAQTLQTLLPDVNDNE